MSKSNKECDVGRNFDKQFEEKLEEMQGMLDGTHPSEEVDDGFNIHSAVLSVTDEDENSTLIAGSRCEGQLLHDVNAASELLASQILQSDMPMIMFSQIIDQAFTEALYGVAERMIENHNLNADPEDLVEQRLAGFGGGVIGGQQTGGGAHSAAIAAMVQQMDSDDINPEDIDGLSEEDFDFLEDFEDEAVDIDPSKFL